MLAQGLVLGIDLGLYSEQNLSSPNSFDTGYMELFLNAFPDLINLNT